jgi:NAD(P)-dependent dehydrogenase (short-subunit alcohol dehydrogenase family)
MAHAVAEPSVDGMKAIITGASRGLGLALATGLVEQGWSLVVDARSPSDLAEAAGWIGGDVTALAGDIRDPAHRAALVEAAGEVDLLVNNAGILGPSPQPRLAAYPVEVLRDVYEVNVFAPLALTQLTLPSLRAREGAVVNVTSDAAVEGYEGWGGYGSAKAALEQAGNVLAVEEPGLRVWRVDPGDLRTRMHQEAFPGEDISDRPLPETVVPAFVKLVTERPPSGRVKL